MKWSSMAVLHAGLLVVALILISNGVITGLNLKTLVESNYWMVHTVEVRRAIDRVFVLVKSAETAQRGYLLSSNEKELAEYRVAARTVHSATDSLAELIADNPRQQAMVAELRAAVGARITQLSDLLQLQSSGNRDVAIRTVATARGRATMLEMSRIIDAMQLEEVGLFSRRSAAVKSSIWTTAVTLSVAKLASVVLLGFALYLTRPRAVARRRVEVYYRHIVECAPDAMVIVDSAGKIVLINNQVEAIFGYSRDELMGRDVEILLPERFRAAHPGQRRQFNAAPHSRPMGERRVLFGLHKDGREFPVEISLSPLQTEDGFLVSAAIRDVTERQRVEATLSRQAALIDIARDCMMVRRLDGKISFWNRGAEMLYGWTSAEAVGMSSHSLLKTVFPLPLAEIDHALVRDGMWEGELVHTNRDGDKTSVASSWVLQRDEENRPVSVLEINKDVTERRRMELRFKGLLESAPDAMVVVDDGGRIVVVNTQTESLFGYTREKLVGREVEYLMPERFHGNHPAQRRDFTAAPRVRLMGEGRELYGLKANGSEFPVEISLSPIETEDGLLVCAAIRDVSARKQIEADLRQRENYFRLLVDGVHDYAIFMLDPHGNIATWNSGAERLKGYRADEIVGRHFSCFYTHEDRAEGKPEIELQTAMTAGRCEDDGWRVRKDGSRFWANVTITAQRDDAGILTGYSKITRDVTERKQAEEELARQARLLEVTHDSIMVRGLEGTISYWNHGAEVRYGWSREEARGQVSHSLLKTRFPEPQEDVENRLVGDGQWEGELVHTKRDGSQIVVASRMVLQRDETGRPQSVLEINNDITERKRADQLLIHRTAQLEAANKELEAFSYSVSHDLRAPLRAIDGFSRILLDDYSEILPEDGKEYVQTVRRNAQKMGLLVDDLLAFARLARQPLNKQTVDVGKLVRQCLDELRHEYDGRRVEFTLGDLPSCFAEPAVLKQVWTNLISNAIKYTRTRDVATIAIGVLSDGDSPDDRTYFIKDNGAGFDMRYVNKLFGVFQRLHRAEEYEGTGVGLAIVQRIVQRHGGRVWADARLNQGATFYFTLGQKVLDHA